MPPSSLREQLVRDEGGYQRFVYDDKDATKKLGPGYTMQGVPTIGVGRNLRDKGISHTESDFLLDNDITEASAEVSAEIPWSIVSLDEIRREALINLSFNMGIGGLIKKNPKFVDALRRGKWEEAASELLDGPYKKQVGPRAFRLAEQIRRGERQ